ncbi:VWA domain-containing protein [Kribbella sp. NBC_00382]|uniref:vWA domain-containing protein n=1 Tax=Kribbella sp. NBC_00382 TaxID=2975967 RepID=UPI002E1E7AF9
MITLVVDTSDSIAQIGALDGLNSSLRDWGDEMRKDANLQRIGQVAVVTFGPDVRTIDGSGASLSTPADPFVDVARFNPRELSTGGFSPMLEGIERGIDVIRDGARALDRQNLLLAWRPTLCLISDGAPTRIDGSPTNRLREVTQRLRAEEDAHNLVFFAIGVPGADDQALRTLAGPDGYYRLAEVNFMHALKLLSASVVPNRSTSGNSAEEIKRDARQDVEQNPGYRDWLVGAEK